MNLLELADKYLTDKGTNFFDKAPGAGHMYAPVYDLFLSHLRDKSINLLEIGVAKGASLCMWQEYFKNATIVGLDITLDHVDKSRPLGVEGGGWPDLDTIVLKQGSQVDANVLDNIFNEYKSFDVVIDDGSHFNEHQQFTFKHIWPKLRSGDIYIIEDIHYEKQNENSTLNSIFKIMLNSDSFECQFMNVLYTDANSLTCILKK
jgi:predicted O-methyltransferase YrrM